MSPENLFDVLTLLDRVGGLKQYYLALQVVEAADLTAATRQMLRRWLRGSDACCRTIGRL